jgi:signal transduction histidine kinase/ActR/RegA family two-component response regulator
VAGVVRLLRDAAAILAPGHHSAEQSLKRAIDLVCDATGWPLAHVYLLDRDSMQLRPTDIWHADDDAAIAHFTDGASASGTTASIAAPIVSGHGIEGVIEFFPRRARPDRVLFDLLAHVGALLGAVLERERTGRALADIRARLSDAERLGRMGTWHYHIDEDLLEWSPELKALYGLGPDTTPTTLDAYLSRVHPADRDRVRDGILRCVETRREFEHEYRLMLLPGDGRWAHSRGMVVHRGGRPNMLTGHCQDVTEQKRRESSIRRSREQLAEAERLAQLGSWSWDPDTNEFVCSDQLFRLFSIEPGAPPTRKAFRERVHPDDLAALEAAAERAMQHDDLFEYEFRIVRPDGAQRWMHVHAELMEGAEGRGARFAGYTQDITDRREAENERARLESMLSQSRRLESLGQLAGGVAHDFNNLLAAILSYTGFVTEGLVAMAAGSSDPRSSELLSDLQQISRAAARGADLTRRLLTFGRREVVRPQVLVLDDVVRGVEPLLRRSLGPHIELSTPLARDLWRIEADPGQLEQVLVNLAVNARDAMSGAGRLAIETANVTIVPDGPPTLPPVQPGRYVQLRVSDTGQGMSPDVAARAFEPFFTTKPKGHGSGLGLATVHGIVGQAGGGLRIESTPGQGATIVALWPATDEPQRPSEDANRKPAGRPARQEGGPTVLIVEDEAPLLEATRRILMRAGYTVLTASSGSQAIALARSHPREIAVLLTDLIMPQMLGGEVVAAVTALRPNIRTIYMSGYASALFKADGSLEPGTLLLEKPFTEEDLLATTRRAIEGSDRDQ